MKIKKILTGLMLVVGVSSLTNAAEYTVAKDGNDSNVGTNETPFRTISKCAELAIAGDTCWVRAGIYRETVTPAHSGTANSPISFKAVSGDKVLISGADVVTGFSNAGNGRYRANIGWDLGLGQNQVFANGKMLWEARYPNANSDVMSAMSGKISNPQKVGSQWSFNDSGLPAGLQGAQINILPGPEWVAETGTVTSSRADNITFAAPYGQLKDTFYNLRESNPYMVWGHPALLDDSAEFYHSGDSLEVMVDPATHQIEAKRRDYAFILDHRAHIVIDGFHVFAATITTGNPNPSSADLSRYPNSATSHHISINNVHFRYVSHFTHILPGTVASGAGVFLAWNKGMTNTGVMLFGANHSLTKSSIAFSAGNGIALAGTNHLVEDTVVHDVNYSVTDGAALLAGFYDIESSGHIVRFNSFSRGARSILTHRGVKDLKVIFNDLYDAGLVASDLGITYTYQTDGTGTEIARNLIHGNTREGDFIGIYLDNGSNGMTIHHNTVWDVTKALQLNIPSTNNAILNNTLMGNKQSVSSWAPPNLSTANISGTNLSNNILVGERNVYGLVDSLNFDGSHNYETLNVADLQFVDALNNDFRLLASSPAVDTGRVIEGITGAFDGALPDMGAIEGVSHTPGAGISQPCVYGDNCAPRYVTGEVVSDDDNNSGAVNILLNNEGLETPFNALAECDHITGNIANNWSDNTCWDDSADIVYAQDTENPHSGISSQRITTQGSLVQFVQSANLTENASYTASVWLRSNSPMEVTLMLRQTDTPYETYHQETMSLSTQWQQVSFTGTTPTEEIFWMILTEDKGTFWVDDAVLSDGSAQNETEEIAETPPREEAQNNTSGGGSFPLQGLFLIFLSSFFNNKRVLQRVVFLMVIAVVVTPAQAENVNFTPDKSVILNPERGLAKLMTVGDDSISELRQLRQDHHTIAWGIIRLDDYRNNKVLPAIKMDEIKRWLDEVRASRVKSILRIVYHEVASFDSPEASLAIQEAHLEQLGTSVFIPYEDVIVAHQAGGIGAYGEWYYAPSSFTSSASRKQLLNKMYDVIDDNAFVMVRTPYYKQEYEASLGSADRVYRTAHYNDCFLSNTDDTGTYACYPWSESCPTVDALQSYVSNDSLVVPVGGETCNSTVLNDCAGALNSMAYYGYSFINTLWFSSIRSKWENQGCFNTIAKKLGYHFELVSAVVPDSISPSSNFTVSVTLKNTGWAPMYHARPVYIRMMDANGNELLYYWTGADPRNWKASNQTYTISNTFLAPANIDTSSVSLSLWMPDELPANYAVAEYAIRFANKGVWDSSNGNNLLKANIPVGITPANTPLISPSKVTSGGGSFPLQSYLLLFLPILFVNRHKKRWMIVSVFLLPLVFLTTNQAQANDRIVTPKEGGYLINSVEHQRLYGPGLFVLDNLWNLDIGGSEKSIVSARFRATKSGSIESLITSFRANSSRFGYAKGTGGKIRLRVFPDDGSTKHYPDLSANPLGIGFYLPNLDSQARHIDNKDTWKPVVFSSPIPIVYNRLYHIVFDNVDADPENNYLGFNAGVQVREHGSPSRWTSPIDWGVLQNSFGSDDWEDNTRDQIRSDYLSPSLQFTMSDGSILGHTYFGMGNYESQAAILSNTKTGNQYTSLLLERFTPLKDKVITGLSFLAGSTVAGSLEWRITHQGNVLQKGLFTDTNPTYVTHTRTSGGPYGQFKWYDAVLNTDVIFKAGKQYDIEFRAVGDSEWRTANQRTGEDYGFKTPSAFTESQAFYIYDGQLIKHYGWEKGTDYGFSNWRVVLHTKAQSDSPQRVEDEWFMPKPSTTWQIQLQGDVNTNYGDAEMYDIDLYDSSEALIQQLQARGKNVICYFSAGSYENWRPDADQFNASDLGRALDGWPGERWLDIRSNNVREIMKRRLDLAEQKGCGGVDPDNMDGYLNESGLPINAQDQLSFNRFIAKEAHDRGLSVGLKNDLDQIEDLVDHFDFAVNEQCFQFNECDLLTPFINQGKAVFQIEYAQKYTTGANAEATRNKLCGDAQSLKLSTLVMPLLLDDEFRLSCLDENGSSGGGEQQDGTNSGETTDTEDTDNTEPNDITLTSTTTSGGGSIPLGWLGLLVVFGIINRRLK